MGAIPTIPISELFSEEYERYACRAIIGGNEVVHNVRGNTIDVNLRTDTQVPKEY